MTLFHKIYFFVGLLAALVISHVALAQESNFSMYQHTPFLTNPGSIGVIEDVRTTLNYRNQSVSTGVNFQTSMISGFYPVNIGNHRLGIGGTFINDKFSDFMKANGGMLGLAYSIQLFPGSELSLGFQGGYFQRGLNFDFTTDAQFVDGSFNPGSGTGEPLVNSSKGYMTGSTGLYWQLKDKSNRLKGFVGASIFNFNQSNVSFIEDGEDKLPITWKTTAGWRVLQQARFSVMPTLRWVHQTDNNFVNAGSLFKYDMNRENEQQLGFGLWYNTNKAGVVSLEYSQANLTLAGSYDLPMSSEISTSQKAGIFELALSIRLKKKTRPYPVTMAPVEEVPATQPVVEEQPVATPSEKVAPVEKPVEKPQTIDRLSSGGLSSSPTNLQPVHREMKLAEKDKVTLEKTVKFDFQTSDLTPDSKAFLNDIAGIMKDNEWLKIELTGHTCNVGSNEVNENISRKRAEEVQGYLIAQGVSPDRFIIKAKGETSPIADNSTEAGRIQNRRVEFRIIEE